MVKCPEQSLAKRIFSLSRKFNRILEEMISNDKHSHYLEVEVPADQSNFDHTGNLTQNGKIKYWHTLDDTMNEFDRGDTDLVPKRQHQSLQVSTNNPPHNQGKFFKHKKFHGFKNFWL